jgi:SAM-dependent methyltransferase
MQKHSADYHDYVFRDGKLVGEFEDMYRFSQGVPWHQDEQANWIDVRLTEQLLRDLAPFAEIHDLGCGLGFYLALMRERLGGEQCAAFGYDVSKTACSRAREKFPEFTFRALDLTLEEPPRAESAAATAQRRLFTLRGTLWYVFPKIAAVVRVIRGLMRPDDLLLVAQNFLPLEREFIGKDVIPDHAALIAHFGASFRTVRHLWYEDTLRAANDNWFIGLFTPKETQ